MSVYFDNNATTQPDERVVDAMLPFLRAGYGNPSGVHGLARDARSAVDGAREHVAALVNVHVSQVLFTSGGTEANNIALKGAVWGMAIERMVVSAVEHASVMDVAAYLRESGCQVRELDVDHQGVVDMAAARGVVEQFRPQFCSVMAANNETGAVQPTLAVADLVRANGGVMHIDAVQALGKVPVDFLQSGAHLMSLSGHKIYGPKGVGALIVDKAIDFVPLFHGGGQERGLRSGTENVAAIVGFGKAAQLALKEGVERSAHVLELRRELERRLRSLAGVTLFSDAADKLPNTVFFGANGIDGETLIVALDTLGVAVASGAACASKSARASHVLLAMGIEESLARSAVRVSLGHNNTFDEVSFFVRALEKQLKLFSSMPALW